MTDGASPSDSTSDIASDNDAHESLRLAIDMGHGLIDRLARTDFKRFEIIDAEHAVGQIYQGPGRQLLRVLNTSIRLLAFLPRQTKEIPAEENTGPLPNFGAEATEGSPSPVHDRFLQEVDTLLLAYEKAAAEDSELSQEMLVDTCNLVINELVLTRRRFQVAMSESSKWRIISEGEEAKRKTSKALQAGMVLANGLLKIHSTELEHSSEEQRALLVRDLVMPFSSTVLGLIEDAAKLPYPKIVERMLELGQQFDAFYGESSYEHLRVQDRHQFQLLRHSYSAWITTGRSETQARQILTELTSFAENLRKINQREVLLMHDRKTIQECLTRVATLMQPEMLKQKDAPEEYASILLELTHIRWRDPDFDMYLDTERADQRSQKNFEIKGRIDILCQHLKGLLEKDL